MNVFFIVSGCISFLIYIAYAVFTKAPALQKFCSAFYALVFGIYLYICGPAFDFLINLFRINIAYIYIFLISATAVSLIAPVLTLISIFLKNKRVSNIMFNIYFFVITASFIGLLINCLMSNMRYSFILVFLPAHYLLSVILSVSSLEYISVKTQKIKMIIAYSIIAAACTAAIVGMIISSIQNNVVNTALFALIITLVCTGFTGIVSTLIFLKSLKSR